MSPRAPHLCWYDPEVCGPGARWQEVGPCGEVGTAPLLGSLQALLMNCWPQTQISLQPPASPGSLSVSEKGGQGIRPQQQVCKAGVLVWLVQGPAVR